MKYSLTTKLTVVFAVAFSLVCMLFFTFANMQRNNTLEKTRDKQLSAINYLVALYERSNPPSDLAKYFANFGLRTMNDEKTIKDVLERGQSVFVKQTPLGLFRSILRNDNLFLSIKNPSFIIVLESQDTKNVNDTLWIAFFLTVALLISLYVSVINSLLPLKKLSRDLRKFGSGNMDIVVTCPKTLNADDEIANVAIEFNNAVCKIRELIRSRQLFLRTIMHELKTPIGKGRIISEMVQNEMQKSRLISIFERLDMLINEFGKIEQLLSKSYALKYQEYYFSIILDQAKDMLMLENFENKVQTQITEDVLLRVDFQLFSLAIKNLIDNALKYSEDRKAALICKNDKIYIKNKGKALERPIEYYMQAFIREKDSKIAGMGLGLYIIDHICQMHRFKLRYKYIGGYHHFIIDVRGGIEKRT